MTQLLIIHLAITCAITGLIWTIQCLQYPLFGSVGEAHFKEYHARHMRRITLLVGPLVVAEAATAGLLLYYGNRQPLFLVSLIPLGFAWLSTAVFQVPIHTKLLSGWDAALHQKLMRTNWIRTVSWTLRAVLLTVS